MIPIHTLPLSGSYYENGFDIGTLLKQSKTMQIQFNELQKAYSLQQNIDEIKEILSVYCPPLLEELQGIIDGSGFPEADILRLLAGYDMPQLAELGCTSFITSEFYVRNYDFSPKVYDGLFIENNTVYGNSQFLVGRLDGMNRDGLVVGLHFVNNEFYQKGFVCSTIVRIVLEMCKNVDEAIQLLKKLPHAACYNYSLLDRKGNFAVAEASPKDVQILTHPNELACVNKFQTKIMEFYNRNWVGSSNDRLAALENATSMQTVEELHDWFSQTDSPLFYTDYDQYFGTLYTVSYIPTEQKIYLTTAGSKERYLIDMK
ncbi:C45 family autoproteolytic acyltransferase/hydrolase [Lederbergia wuyishanensis]|uniref:Choloylglycine hydrolase n=1 Tax=Lederbergia wuyishanensis TaxID=1347903 RepID=A0ABU0D6M4_9BACI|nr:C45 family peptidase [Lederbergia wuyishanensis]MCJ8008527.1 C45 family peptidase [Lederbergia wuyishanensis]MDQ0344059.1 putative choloylglycine hydrolase [Lederbergia wuyishanensis]